MARVTVTIDCIDPDLLAEFWAEALGYGVGGRAAQYRAIRPSESPRYGPGPKLIFQGVPEPKSGKNRLHLDLDLDPGTPLAEEVTRLEELGATAGTVFAELGHTWMTMRDPEGNEFCVVATPAPEGGNSA